MQKSLANMVEQCMSNQAVVRLWSLGMDKIILGLLGLDQVGQNGLGLGFGPTHPYLFTKYFISKV